MQVSASTLTKAQKNKSLSAKKGKAVKVRPVLAAPVRFTGLEITEEHQRVFAEKMSRYNKYLPAVVPKWCDLKNMPKEDRQKMRKLLVNKIPSREHICLGFNEVTRAIENKTATAVIIAGNINPQILCKHIYQCCDLYKIPLIRVPNFKETSKEAFGFACTSMAFKKVPSDAKIYEFYKFIQYWFVDELLKTPAYQEEQYRRPRPIQKKYIKKIEIDEPEKDRNNHVYLYRSDKLHRKFVPESHKRPIQEFDTSFIAFVPESTAVPEPKIPFPSTSINTQEKKDKKFEALKLKKIQKNKKRKFESMED